MPRRCAAICGCFGAARSKKKRILTRSGLKCRLNSRNAPLPNRPSRHLKRVPSSLRRHPRRTRHPKFRYFHNIPNQYLYRDPHLTQPVSRDDLCAHCTRDTGIFIVSDAGAARGFRHLPRLQETIKALVFLQQYTALIVWLNPMPQARWAGSTAQMLDALAPIHPLTRDGFSRALDAVRDQRP